MLVLFSEEGQKAEREEQDGHHDLQVWNCSLPKVTAFGEWLIGNHLPFPKDSVTK